MKIVINRCFGGFSISSKAVLRGREITGDPKWCYPSLKGESYGINGQTGREELVDHDFDAHGSDLSRHDPILVRLVEEMGHVADGAYAELKVVEIPDGVSYEIEEYDGLEHIAETHRTWR